MSLSQVQWERLDEILGRMGYKVKEMSREDMYSLAQEIVTQSTERGKLINAQSPEYATAIANCLRGE